MPNKHGARGPSDRPDPRRIVRKGKKVWIAAGEEKDQNQLFVGKENSYKTGS